MHLSRRSFVRTAGVGGIGVLAAPLIAARGSEALRDGILYEPPVPPTGAAPLFEAEESARWRRALPGAIRLDSNENPNGPGKTALEAIQKMFVEAPRYPDATMDELQNSIARHYNTTPDHVVLGCGSGEILRISTYAFTSPERALVTAAPSFEDPVNHAQMTKAPVHSVPVDSQLRLDLSPMLDKVRGAGLVFFCNPNNPTSTVHGGKAVKDFVAEVNRRAPECVILIDEAYHEYVEDPSYETAVPLALENPKVIVVRTFSKVFGMAGLRAGYAIGRPETLAAMRRHRLGSNVNVLAAAAAMATLSDKPHLDREIQVNRAARDYTVRSLAEMGFKAAPSNTNFIMVPIGRDTRAFKEACSKQGILVGRAFPPLMTYSRISIGTMDEMKQAVDVFRQVLAGAAN